MADRTPYTYTPNYAGTDRSQPNGGYQPPRQQQQTDAYQDQTPQYTGGGYRQSQPSQQHGSDRPMKDLLMLAAILFAVPISGFIGVIYPPLLWIFVVVTAVCLASLWVFRCFVQRTRLVFSAILGVLVIVAFIAAIDLSPKQKEFQTYASSGGNGTASATDPPSILALQQQETQAPSYAGIGLPNVVDETTMPPDDTLNVVTGAGGEGDQTGDGQQGAADPAILGESTAGQAVSGAQQVLINYLTQWKAKNFEEMVKYTKPSWRAVQNSPSQQLYWNHNWWVLNDWSITVENDITGTTADSATFKVIADMTKKSSSSPEMLTQAFSAILIQENGTWYVDPDSMRNGVEVTQTPTPEDYTAAQTAQPDPTTDPNLQLWYNSDGGSFYHTQQKCSEINEKYYNSMKAFNYSQMGEEPYSKLKPCTKCGAPAKPSS